MRGREEGRGKAGKRGKEKREGRIVEYLRGSWLPFKAFKFTKSEINGFSIY